MSRWPFGPERLLRTKTFLINSSAYTLIDTFNPMDRTGGTHRAECVNDEDMIGKTWTT
jgi:hypothetical protein